MTWSKLASGLYASKPSNVEGPVRVIIGLQAIINFVNHFMREKNLDPCIVVTNVSGGPGISTIIPRARAIISTVGGPDSHIVVVARDYNIPCIVGASEIDATALSDGVRIRMKTTGHIEIRNDERLHLTEDHMQVLRKIAFAGAIQAPVTNVDDTENPFNYLTTLGLIEQDDLILLTADGVTHLEAAYINDRRPLTDLHRVGLLTDLRLIDHKMKSIARTWQEHQQKTAKVMQDISNLYASIISYIEKYLSVIPRLAKYLERFELAHQRLFEGNTDYLVSTKLDSYHTIWCQFHEDLLRILQRERDPN
jgi:phosphohistidine swiveling domain-containing protein